MGQCYESLRTSRKRGQIGDWGNAKVGQLKPGDELPSLAQGMLTALYGFFSGWVHIV